MCLPCLEIVIKEEPHFLMLVAYISVSLPIQLHFSVNRFRKLE